MTKEELGKLYPIILTEYSVKWGQLYERECDNLRSVLGSDTVLGFEHIGSTAIPGMTAKPTVDILVDIPEGIEPGPIADKLTDQGYIHMREVTDHIMFVKGYTPTGLADESFHIHMGPKTHESLWDRVYFRDYLSLNPDEQKEYIALKLDLQKKYRHDRDAYTRGKGDYIQRITRIAREALTSE